MDTNSLPNFSNNNTTATSLLNSNLPSNRNAKNKLLIHNTTNNKNKIFPFKKSQSFKTTKIQSTFINKPNYQFSRMNFSINHNLTVNNNNFLNKNNQIFNSNIQRNNSINFNNNNNKIEFNNYFSIKSENFYYQNENFSLETFCYFKIKINNNNNNINKSFSPLNNFNNYPENFGYLKGFISINFIDKILRFNPRTNEIKINFNNFNNNNNDFNIFINFNEIQNVSLSDDMKKIIKIYQNYLKYNKQCNNEFRNSKKFLSINKFIHLNENNNINFENNDKIKAALNHFFIFSLNLKNKDKINVIFINFDEYKNWLNGINNILNNNNKNFNDNNNKNLNDNKNKNNNNNKEEALFRKLIKRNNFKIKKKNQKSVNNLVNRNSLILSKKFYE